MLTKFVVLYGLTSHWHTWVFFILASCMRLSTIRAIIHSYGYGIMFILTFVAVLVVMQKMHVEIECVYLINRLLEVHRLDLFLI